MRQDYYLCSGRGDDRTRPTPVAEILQVLFPYLVRNGIPREKITLVVALGTHSAMTGDELEARVGRKGQNSLIVNHWFDMGVYYRCTSRKESQEECRKKGEIV